MKVLLLLFTGALSCLGGYAQHYLDSLQNQLRNSNQDSSSVMALLALAEYHEYIQSDSNIFYARAAIDLAEKTDLDVERLYAGVSLFFGANLRANYSKALEIAQTNLNTARSLSKNADYYAAAMHQNLCLVNTEMGNTKDALSHLQQCFLLQAKSGKLDGDFWGVYWLKGARYSTNPDSALYYTMKAYWLAREPNHTQRYWGLATAGLANVYEARGKYAEARKYYQEALAQTDRYSNVYIKARIYRDLTGLFNKTGPADSCIYFAHLGLNISQEYNFGDYASRICQLLANLYEKNHLLDSSLKYTKIMIAARDSIFSQANGQQFQYLIFEDEQKQREINLAKERMVRNILTVLLVIIIIITILVMRNTVLKKRNEGLRDKNMLSELQQRTSEMEMQALRAQMNPHFIFNCLNSINLFIMNHESLAASDYLTQFSRLIRLVLNNSKKAWITLDEELEMLKLYLDMEMLRFNSAFQYIINADEITDVFNVFIPPLLLQPFIENAIWHGLMHKENGGTVTISFAEKEDTLYCTIEDNGIGRAAAFIANSKSTQKHKSLGIQITRERLELINKGIDTEKVSFEIEDLVDSDQVAAGTRVNLVVRFQRSVIATINEPALH